MITLVSLTKKLHKLIEKMKEDVKKQEPYIKKCEEYGEDVDFIDNVEIKIEPLDVSAKTINGVIIINENIVLNSDWEDIEKYVIHEVSHCLQQEHGLVNEKVEKDKYLDDKNEQEAFQVQLEYMDDHEPPEKVQKYLEQLLDHHNIKDKSKRKEYIKKLTKNI